MVGGLSPERGDCCARAAIVDRVGELAHRIEACSVDIRIAKRVALLRLLGLRNVMIYLSLVDLDLLAPVIALGASFAMRLACLFLTLFARLAALRPHRQVVQL